MQQLKDQYEGKLKSQRGDLEKQMDKLKQDYEK